MPIYRRPQRVLPPHPIGHALRTLARWAVATSLTASGACAAQHEDPAVGQTVPPPATAPTAASGSPALAPDAGPQLAAWQGVACQDAKPRLFADALPLTRDVDYLGLYASSRPPSSSSQSARAFLVDAQGTLCAASSDPEICEKSVGRLEYPSAVCQENLTCAPFAITTSQDGLQRIDSPDQALLALIAPIDSPAKAVLAAFWQGLWVACPKAFALGTGQMTLRGTEVSQHDGGWVVRSEWETCGPMSRDSVTLDAQGNLLSKQHEDLGHSGCVVGRRPVGLRAAQPKTMPSALGAYLAGNARLEAASVWAFERLSSELRELGAPASLILAARDAAQDERCHAQLVTQLARSYGAEPTEPRVDEAPPRSPFAIALENAVEGCVRESFGAVLAHYQAALAADPAIAQAMLRIAEDETRHAELAWQVAAWLEPQLPCEQRAELRAAQAAALDELAAELALEGMSAAERAALGWPPSALRARLLESMAAQLGMQAVS